MRTAALFLCIAFSAFGTDYVLYQKNSSPVTNQVVLYRPLYAPAVPNVNYALLSYSLKPAASNWNGVLPSLATNTATIQWCKVSNNLVVHMTATESNSIITAQAAATLASQQARELLAKLAATNALANFFDSPQGRATFAGWEVTLDELNIIRAAVASITNLPPRTLTQLTNAIKAKINAQANNQ